MSRKSFAVGTGAMALSPLVDIVGRDRDWLFSCFRIRLPDWEVIGHTLAGRAPGTSAAESSVGAPEVELKRARIAVPLAPPSASSG
jgi:hypothetical protein